MFPNHVILQTTVLQTITFKSLTPGLKDQCFLNNKMGITRELMIESTIEYYSFLEARNSLQITSFKKKFVSQSFFIIEGIIFINDFSKCVEQFYAEQFYPKHLTHITLCLLDKSNFLPIWEVFQPHNHKTIIQSIYLLLHFQPLCYSNFMQKIRKIESIDLL